ncbi:hypothetical protein BC831DRAFT_469492 [Entophlyctis helioformis]|nr:hypothetical protein BC831DRAFT_469492 [Entophlyctis helioformis]
MDPDTTDALRAYVPPSFVFASFGLYELGAVFVILLTNARYARPSLVYTTSCISFVLVLAYVSLQLATLDHRTRMANAALPSPKIKRFNLAVYVLLPLAQTSVNVLTLSMIRALFSPQGLYYRSMCVLAVISALFYVATSCFGLYLIPPWFTQAFVLAIAGNTIAETTFVVLCSIGFLKKLSKGLSVRLSALVYDVITKHNGQRFVALIILRISKMIGELVTAGGYTSPILFSFNYAQAWLLALELAAIVSFGLESTKRIVRDHSIVAKRLVSASSAVSAASAPMHG